MGQLILDLIPLGLGVMLSPIALLALIAVLVSDRARTNGTAYALGWVFGVAFILIVFYLVFGLLALNSQHVPPLWVPIVRLLLAVVLLGGALWVYRRGESRIKAMAAATTPREVAAATPQLPGWIQAVERFKPGRTFALGVGMFVLNPVDASCAIVAALDIRLAAVTPTAAWWTLAVFGVIGVLPIVVPVVLVLIRGAASDPVLRRLRGWVAGHTHVLNAALLLVIAVLQLQKGISTLLAY